MNNGTHSDLVPAENPDGRRPTFTIQDFIGRMQQRRRRNFEYEALAGLTAEKARELAQVDYDAQIRVRQAMVSELFDTTIFEGRDRLVRRIAPKLFSTQRHIFDEASASGLGRTPLERTLVGVGVSSLSMLLLGGLPQGATLGQDALVESAFRAMDLSRGIFEESRREPEDIWTDERTTTE